jgi:hypothetical protein
MAKTRAAQAKATLSAYRRLFSTDDGKTVLKDLMQSCHFLSSSAGKDANETYYNEGMRSVVLRLMNTSKLSTEQIERLTVEIGRNADYIQ